jgi:hypothetical protein
MKVLKKVMIAVVVIAGVSLGSVGSIYAYQKEEVKQNTHEERFFADGTEYYKDCDKENCQNDCECLKNEYHYYHNHSYKHQKNNDCEQDRQSSEHKYSHNYNYQNDKEGEYSGNGHGRGSRRNK